jgi:6-phosphogluconate dehydrogenase
MIGAGSMGGGMALLLAEKGISVAIQDPSEETVDKLIKSAAEQGIHDKLSKHEDYKDLCSVLSSPKVIFFSLPHGTVGDTVVEGLHLYLEKGDIIVDCSNEEWENTQRRQGKLIAQGVYYIGCGVSGGYQAARRGPSMCPGGEEKALDVVMPLFEKMAAKAEDGSPCVAKIGEGGAGHYVKMIHNGIEHGMMCAISEAWAIMNKHIGMEYDEIGKFFEKWSSEGELVVFAPLVIGPSLTQIEKHFSRQDWCRYL